MDWFFDNAEAVQRLRTEAESWRGTPFAQWSRAKGPHGGVDCVGYVEALMAGAGLPQLDFPRSDSDYSRHVHNDKIVRYLRGEHEDPQSARLAEIFAEFPVVPEVRDQRSEISEDNPTSDLRPPTSDFSEPPMPGDILILKDSGREGKRFNGVFHMPVMTGPRKFTHCTPPIGVTEGMIQDSFARRTLVAHFRARHLPT